MNIKVLKSKIHNAVVTGHNIDYDGSIGIDADFIKAAGLSVYEKVHLLNIDNGRRLETYVIEAPENSGEICINGAAAHLVCPGDLVIIVSYCRINHSDLPSHKPFVVHVDKQNAIIDVGSHVLSE